MASRITINKDVKKRQKFTEKENQYRIFKILSNDLYMPIENRHIISYLYVYSNCEALYRSYVKNKCALSGRNRSVYSFFKLTRMFLKNLSVKGYITGVRKYSW